MSHAPLWHFAQDKQQESKQILRHPFDSQTTGPSGRPLAPMTGPPRWAVDIDRGPQNQLTHPGLNPGLGSLEEGHQAASYSPVGVVGAVARRSAPRE